MSGRNDGGPAFPAQVVDGGCDRIGKKGGVWFYPGMTLRDYFAVHATEHDVQCALIDLGMDPKNYPMFSSQCSGTERNAIARYAFADAMLKARSA